MFYISIYTLILIQPLLLTGTGEMSFIQISAMILILIHCNNSRENQKMLFQDKTSNKVTFTFQSLSKTQQIFITSSVIPPKLPISALNRGYCIRYAWDSKQFADPFSSNQRKCCLLYLSWVIGNGFKDSTRRHYFIYKYGEHQNLKIFSKRNLPLVFSLLD